MTQLENLQQIDRSRNIEGTAVRLYFLSRSPRVLAGVAAGILAIGLGLAFLLQSKEPALTKRPKIGALKAELARETPDVEKIVTLLSRGAARDVYAEEGAGWIASSKLSNSDKSVITALWASLTEWPVEPTADLLFYAHNIQPLRHANELVGDLYLSAKQKDDAIIYYEREGKNPEATGARQKLFTLLLEKRDFAGARRIANDPAIGPQLTPANRVMLTAGERRWHEILQPLLAMEKEYLKPMPTLLAGLAGLVWLIIALQAIQPPRLISFRTIVPLLAVAAGVASVLPTLFAVLFEEEMWKLKQTGDSCPSCFCGGAGSRC